MKMESTLRLSIITRCDIGWQMSAVKEERFYGNINMGNREKRQSSKKDMR